MYLKVLSSRPIVDHADPISRRHRSVTKQEQDLHISTSPLPCRSLTGERMKTLAMGPVACTERGQSSSSLKERYAAVVCFHGVFGRTRASITVHMLLCTLSHTPTVIVHVRCFYSRTKALHSLVTLLEVNWSLLSQPASTCVTVRASDRVRYVRGDLADWCNRKVKRHGRIITFVTDLFVLLRLS